MKVHPEFPREILQHSIIVDIHDYYKIIEKFFSETRKYIATRKIRTPLLQNVDKLIPRLFYFYVCHVFFLPLTVRNVRKYKHFLNSNVSTINRDFRILLPRFIIMDKRELDVYTLYLSGNFKDGIKLITDLIYDCFGEHLNNMDKTLNKLSQKLRNKVITDFSFVKNIDYLMSILEEFPENITQQDYNVIKNILGTNITQRIARSNIKTKTDIIKTIYFITYNIWRIYHKSLLYLKKIECRYNTLLKIDLKDFVNNIEGKKNEISS